MAMVSRAAVGKQALDLALPQCQLLLWRLLNMDLKLLMV